MEGVEEKKDVTNIDKTKYMKFMYECIQITPFLRLIKDRLCGFGERVSVYGGFLRWCTERFFENETTLPDFTKFDGDYDICIHYLKYAQKLFQELFQLGAIIELMGKSNTQT